MTAAEIPVRRPSALGHAALLRGSRFLLPIVLIVIISIVSPSFFTVGNAVNVLRQSSLLFVLAAAQTLVILTEGIDLSVGSVVGLSACLAGGFIIGGGNNGLGVLVALVVGSILGLANGLMVAKARLPAFIATYGMMMLARGFAVAYMQGNVYWGFNPAFRFLGAGSVGPIPVPVLIAIAVFILVYFLLHFTNFGRSIYYVGNNRRAALLAGFHVDRLLVQVYALAGLIGAFAGLMYVSRLNSAEASLGTGFELDVIASVVVGGTSFFKADGDITNAVYGALMITLLRNAMNLVGVSQYWQPFVIGFLIVVIVAAERISSHKQGYARD